MTISSRLKERTNTALQHSQVLPERVSGALRVEELL